MPNRHPITGCRTDTIFGLWLYPAAELAALRDAAWAIVAQGDAALVRCGEESKQVEVAKEKGFRVEDGIAHISLSGPMTKYPTSFQSLFGGTSTIKMREALREIKQDVNVKGILLHADSPGGTAEGTAELAAAIRDLNEAKPVFVHAEDKATSGALWAGTQGSRFTCGPTAMIGSLGTMIQMWDRSGENGTSKPVLIVTGNNKGIGAEGHPITPEHKAELQRLVDGINKPFKQDVFASRPAAKAHADEILTARVFVGKDAKRVGLVDDVCTTEEALQSLKQLVQQRTLQTTQQTNKTTAGLRSPAVVVNHAANKRSTAMPLTAEQLKSARELPGAASITEENADVTLLTVATQLHSNLKVQQQVGNDGSKKVGELETLVAELKGKIPVPMDPGLAKGKAELAMERIDLMKEKGLILPTQVAKLKGAFLVGDKPNEIFLQDAVQKTMFDILAENKPHGLLKEISAGQPAPQVTPGVTGAAKEVPTFKQWNETRAKGGLSADTKEQYQQRFGVEAGTV